MASRSKSAMITEYIWSPLVLIPTNSIAFLTHPGTNIVPRVLLDGWRWHWPYLTTIVILNFQSQRYLFAGKKTQSTIQDEAITAVSLDHQLLTIEGEVSLRLDHKANHAALSVHNHNSENRIIKPIIRQCIRACVAKNPAATYTAKNLESDLTGALQHAMKVYGILIEHASISSIEPFAPTVTK